VADTYLSALRTVHNTGTPPSRTGAQPVETHAPSAA